MQNITDNYSCCGCGVCSLLCPQNAITMKENDEGFLYPVINDSLCINCHFCQIKCPINSISYKDLHSKNKFYIARTKNGKDLKESTSGGFISPLVSYILENNGFVCGAVMTTEFDVKHEVFNNNNIQQTLKKLRGSKYVQSDSKEAFKYVKDKLLESKIICYIGTPCQVAALYSYLGNINTSNLITVDLVCHGVPSPKLWRSYLNYQIQRYKSDIKSISFRNKTYGYHGSTMKISFNNGKEYYGSVRTDYYLKSFFSEICSRYSCYKCHFKGISRLSDITVYDCWRPDKMVKKLSDDNRGYTNVITHSMKADKIIKKIENRLELYEIEENIALKYLGKMVNESAKKNQNRDKYYTGLHNNNFIQIADKYITVSTIDRIIERIKFILFKLGIYRILQRIFKRI